MQWRDLKKFIKEVEHKMNRKINTLEYSKLLFTDIETVAQEENFNQTHPNYPVWAWKQRDKETNELQSTEENIKAYKNKAALNAEWGKIVCISVGYIHNEELHIKSFTGEEKEILTNFVNLVKSSGRMIAGHNVIGFDVPYIRKRFFINGLKDYLTEGQGNDVYTKPWLLDDSIFDTMVAFKGSGYYNTSLDELAMVFNIPSSKSEYHGNQVGELYYSGGIKEIAKYCEGDVAVVANLLRVWKGDCILEPILRDVEIEEQPILSKLYKASEISEEDRKKIESLIKKKKPTKKDKEILEDMLTSIYIDNTMFKSDSEPTKERKRNEIKEIINGITK